MLVTVMVSVVVIVGIRTLGIEFVGTTLSREGLAEGDPAFVSEFEGYGGTFESKGLAEETLEPELIQSDWLG